MKIGSFSMTLGFPRFPLPRRNHKQSMSFNDSGLPTLPTPPKKSWKIYRNPCMFNDSGLTTLPTPPKKSRKKHRDPYILNDSWLPRFPLHVSSTFPSPTLTKLASGTTRPLLTLCGPCADLVPLEEKICEYCSRKKPPQPDRPHVLSFSYPSLCFPPPVPFGSPRPFHSHVFLRWSGKRGKPRIIENVLISIHFS